MNDLNDYMYFARVVEHGGFAAAGRALGQPKSKLSRRVAALEARLGSRLIERSSRRFRVTEIGQGFYERCRAMLAEAEQAEALVASTQAEPQGTVRFACPTGLLETLSSAITAFLARYPRVRLQVLAVDRPVDLIGEGIDIALRVRVTLDSDAALTMRSFGVSRRILVASPALANSCGSDVAALARCPTLSSADVPGEVTWELHAADGAVHRWRHEPRMTCGDFGMVRAAAIAGLGVALLPDHSCADALSEGMLVRVAPDWAAAAGIVHIVFTTRRGLPAAVRAFIDHLAASFPREVAVR